MKLLSPDHLISFMPLDRETERRCERLLFERIAPEIGDFCGAIEAGVNSGAFKACVVCIDAQPAFALWYCSETIGGSRVLRVVGVHEIGERTQRNRIAHLDESLQKLMRSQGCTCCIGETRRAGMVKSLFNCGWEPVGLMVMRRLHQ